MNNGVMVSMLASSAVYHGMAWNTKYTALRSKRKDYLSPNEDNVSELDDVYTDRLVSVS